MKFQSAALFGAVCLMLSSTSGHADSAAGQAVFEANECVACHYTDGPAKEVTIEDQLAKQGPELWYAGDKFVAEWLVGWLADPQPIRLLKDNSIAEVNPGDQPAVGGDDAAGVAD